MTRTSAPRFFGASSDFFEWQQHTQDDEHRRHHNKAAYLEPGQGHIVAARGVRGLLDEGDVPRHEGFAADGELDAVYEGHGTRYESHERGAEEHVPEREGKGRGEQGYGQPVQEQNERLAQHLAQHGQDGDGVCPEHEQRHHNAAREAEQYCRQEADGPGVSFQVSSRFLSAYCAGTRVR